MVIKFNFLILNYCNPHSYPQPNDYPDFEIFKNIFLNPDPGNPDQACENTVFGYIYILYSHAWS